VVVVVGACVVVVVVVVDARVVVVVVVVIVVVVLQTGVVAVAALLCAEVLPALSTAATRYVKLVEPASPVSAVEVEGASTCFRYTLLR
jgi:hypothetical protein